MNAAVQTEPEQTTATAHRIPDAGEAAHEGIGSVCLESVTKRYGAATAVNGISLHVKAGEFLSLLGPSGCGKTTTLRMLAGFEQPDSGSIRISGNDVIGIPPHKRNVNTVFQAYALFPHMSVAENVAYGLRQKRVPKIEVRSRVSEALAMVQMARYADRKPQQLSGGQQQRIALARALVNRPGVLLLDEPLGALDRQLREEMQIELKLLQARLGITFIFVTHDQGEALSMSDRIAIMREGRIEQLGDPDTIYDEPATAYVAGFIGQQNFIAGSIGRDARQMEAEFGFLRTDRIQRQVLPAGSAVQAAVRPESVRITDVAPPVSAANTVPGELIGISHLGETIQFVISIGSDRTMLANLPRPSAPRLAIGTPVWCSWEARDVQFFPAEQAALARAEVAAAAINPPPPTHPITLKESQ